MSDRYNDMIAFAQVQQKVARGENMYWNNSYEINNLRRSQNATNALSNQTAEVQTLFQLGIIRSLYTSNLQLGNISNQLGDLSIQLGKNHHEVMSGFNNLANILQSNQLQTNALFRQLIYAVDHQRDFGRVKLGNYKIQELLLEDGNVFLSNDDDIKYCLVDKYGEKLIAYKKIALMESRGQNPWNSRDADVVSIINLINAANPPNPDQLLLLNSLYPHLSFRNTREEQEEKDRIEMKKQNLALERVAWEKAKKEAWLTEHNSPEAKNRRAAFQRDKESKKVMMNLAIAVYASVSFTGLSLIPLGILSLFNSGLAGVLLFIIPIISFIFGFIGGK